MKSERLIKSLPFLFFLIILVQPWKALSQPILVLEENMQRNFYCEADISVIEDGNRSDLLYLINRKGNIIKISFDLSSFIDDPYEAENLKKLGINSNTVLYDMDGLLVYFIFPDIQAYVIQSFDPEDSLFDFTFFSDKKNYKYEKAFESSENQNNRFSIRIKHKQGTDDWAGYILESVRYMNFPVKAELYSEKRDVKLIFNFRNISFEDNGDELLPPGGYKKFDNYTQMLIYAIERQK